jgi:hypothetical protein
MSEDLLKYFCKAAGHEPCPSWQVHRFELNKIDQFIHLLISSIPDSIAVGKSVQKARSEGQTSLTGKIPDVASSLPDHRDPDIAPAVVDWDIIDDGDELRYQTADKHVQRKTCYYRQDCRKESILAYKPRRVLIFFDGIQDEWNEWR